MKNILLTVVLGFSLAITLGVNAHSGAALNWWNETANYSWTLSVTNPNITDTMVTGMPFQIHFNHAGSLIAGNCGKVDGSDVYVVYKNTTQIDCVNETAFYLTDTIISCSIQEPLAASAITYDYSLYCGGNITAKRNAENTAGGYKSVTAMWLMNTGTVKVNDEHLNNFPLSVGGSPEVYNNASCLWGNCLYFNQDNSNYLYSDTFLDDMTPYVNGMSVIVVMADYSGVNEDLILYKSNSGGNTLYFSADTTKKHFYTDNRAGGSVSEAHQSPLYLNNTFQRAGFTWAASGDQYIYIDGDNQSILASISGIMGSGSSTDFYFGRHEVGTNAFKGVVDEVMVFNQSFNISSMKCLLKGWSQYPFISCLDRLPVVVFGAGTSLTPSPPPAGAVTNIMAAITYCSDNNTLFSRDYGLADNGSAVLSDRYLYCRYGCQNSTITGLGAAGCAESPLQTAILFGVALIGVIAALAWLNRR